MGGLGPWGEGKAAAYLESHGYRIVERNYRCRAGEIDLVVRRGETLVFVEVKTRCSLQCGWPAESVTLAKQHHIRRTALWYVAERCPDTEDLRLDVIEILVSGGRAYLRHTENAF